LADDPELFSSFSDMGPAAIIFDESESSFLLQSRELSINISQLGLQGLTILRIGFKGLDLNKNETQILKCAPKKS
jgi:hypothetical protein